MDQQQTPAIGLRIPPQPVLNNWEIQVDPDQSVVILVSHSPTGINFFFMDADGCQKLSDQLGQAARQAKSGLLIAPNLSVLQK